MARVQEIPLINLAMYNMLTLLANIIIIHEITSTIANISKQYLRPRKDEKTGVRRFPTADPRSEVDATHDPSNSVTMNVELLQVRYGRAGDVQESTVPFPIVRIETVKDSYYND